MQGGMPEGIVADVADGVEAQQSHPCHVASPDDERQGGEQGSTTLLDMSTKMRLNTSDICDEAVDVRTAAYEHVTLSPALLAAVLPTPYLTNQHVQQTMSGKQDIDQLEAADAKLGLSRNLTAHCSTAAVAEESINNHPAVTTVSAAATATCHKNNKHEQPKKRTRTNWSTPEKRKKLVE